jgi:hypothetical protein
MTIHQVVNGGLEFDVCLCTEQMLPSLKTIARVLKQKMPTVNKGLNARNSMH